MGSRLKGASKVTATSSKSSVVEAAVNKYSDKYYIQLGTKKKGTSNITIKVQKAGKVKTYKTKVTVQKYSNPAKTFKVGSKNYAGGFKKLLQYHNVKFPAGKAKVSVKANSGWKINNITVSSYGASNYSKVIKNNSTFDFSKLSGIRKSIVVSFTNTKTKLKSALFLTSY